MSVSTASRQDIIMSYNAPPASDDLCSIAYDILQALPSDLAKRCQDLNIKVEEFPDAAIEQEMELEDSYDLLALFRSCKEIIPGVQKKIGNGQDCLILYRRPILDLWCETGDDLSALLREVIIEEIARACDFSEGDIQSFLKTI